MKYIKQKNTSPEGAISLEFIDKIYLSRLLEEGGAEDLLPVLQSFSAGQILEEQGKLKEAQKLYKATLKRSPNNPWLTGAIERIKYSLN